MKQATSMCHHSMRANFITGCRCLLLLLFLLASLTFAQSPTPPITTSQVTLPVSTTLAPVSSVNISLQGNPGPQTYYYWVVTNYTLGSSSPVGPFVALNAPNTLSSSNYVALAPTYPGTQSSIDVLRTITPVSPTGACACAVATGVTFGSVNDQSNSLSAYTVSPLNLSNFLITLTNEVTGSGATHPILRQNGQFVLDLFVSGTGTITNVVAGSGISGGGTSGSVTVNLGACPNGQTQVSTGSAYTCGPVSGATLQTNGTNNTSQSALNFQNSSGAGGISFTNPSGGNSQAALNNTSSTVNGQTCTLGAVCAIPFQTNSSANTSVAGINFLNSTVNADGLTVTALNSATNHESFEVGGTYIGGVTLTGDVTASGSNATTVKGLNGTALSGLATGILKNTTGTGVPSIAAFGDVTVLFSGCSGIEYLGADGACHAAGTGTVTVSGAGTLTSTALVTGAGAQTTQTPSATATMDASGNIQSPGALAIAGPRPWIDITAPGYAADRTGVADATTAINNAITACGTGTVFFPQGTYQIRTSVNLNSAGCTLLGYNRASTLLKWSGTTTTFDLLTVTANNTTVSGLTIDGNAPNLSGTPCGAGNANLGCGHALVIKNTTGVRVTDNVVQNSGSIHANIYCISNGGTLSWLWIQRNTVIPSTTGSGATADGIFCENNTSGSSGMNHVWITDNKVDASSETAGVGAAHGIAVHGTNSGQDVGEFNVSGNDIIAPGGSHAGFCLEIGPFIAPPNTAHMPHDVTVASNKCILSAAGVGGYSFVLSHSTVLGNTANSNGFAGTNTGLETVFSEHTTITGNTVGPCEGTSSNGWPDGFSLDTMNFNTVSANTVCGFISANGNAGMHLVQAHTVAPAVSSIVGSGNTYTITFASTFPTQGAYGVDAWFGIRSCSGVTAYNGIWQVQSNPSTASITFVHPTSGLANTVTGCVVVPSASNNIITGNIINDPFTTTATQWGILAQNNTAGIMSNNIISANVVIGNNSGGGQTGIGFTNSGAGTVDNNKIETSQLRDLATGIFVGANVTNTYVRGNDIFNFATAQINAAAGTLQYSDEPTAFANYAACVSAIEGNIGVVTDDNTAVAWGSTVTGSGTNHVQMYCDGTNWTIAAK